MISGSATPPFYYAMMCKEQTNALYLWLGLVWVSSLAALIVSMHPSQKDFKNTWILALSFALAGLSVVPGVAYMIFFMEDKYLKTFPAGLFVACGFFYLFGAFLFAKRWPEKQYVGKFDLCGNSHNIFHVCCVVGAYLAWLGSIRAFHER